MFFGPWANSIVAGTWSVQNRGSHFSRGEVGFPGRTAESEQVGYGCIERDSRTRHYPDNVGNLVS